MPPIPPIVRRSRLPIVARRTAALAALSLAAATLLVGFAGSPTPAAAADAKARDWKAAAARLDDLIAVRLRAQKDLVVAPRADDAEFIRRASLDLIGAIPTEAETTTFLKDPSPDKRAALVDRLLASSRHADWFAMWYSNLLVGNQIRDRDLNRRTFNEWMRDQFARNRPYDDLVYDLLTATGNSDSNGAVGFVSSFAASAADAAGKSSRYFLGVQIQCAQCHDHPYDKRIKQTDFTAYASFFFTTTHRRNQTPGNTEISFDIVSYPAEDFRPAGGGPSGSRRTAGMGMMPRGQPLRLEGQVRGAAGRYVELGEPKFLLGKAPKDVPGLDRRTVLAKWMTSKSNEWFAPAYANRLWAYFMGRGIVHPIDDFSQSNKPSNPELLKFLADEFTRNDFDINHLVRTIVGSEAYQRTSKMPRDMERPDPSLYAVAPVKPLTVEQSFDSLFRAAGTEREVERRLEQGMKADGATARGRLVDPRMLVYQMFRRAFDDDEGGESEVFSGTIPRGLLMMNGPQINQMLSAYPGSPLRKILDTDRSDRERVRRVYLTVLSRDPSPGELSSALQHVHTSRTEIEGYEDLMWALCNTTEFMSNH